MIFYFCCLADAATKPPPTAKIAAAYLQKAQREFIEGKYDVALTSYRKYLRKNKRDADVWSQLAVTLYYTGEAVRALDYLKKAEDKAKQKSYNQYHQGLILVSLGQLDQARIPLTRSARYTDEYGARATYELAVLEFNAKDYVKAMYWINLYKQRYSQGVWIAQVIKMEQGINKQAPIEDMEGNKKPKIDDALFKFHPYSLSRIPHYWFMSLGYEFSLGDRVQPDRNSETGTKVDNYTLHDLIVHMGIGLGPVKQQDLTTYFGYNYRQDWYSDDARMTDYFDVADPSELILYLPFRPDLMERTHRLYTQMDYALPYGLFAGANFFQEFSFLGSTLVPGPEGDQVEQRSQHIGEASLIQPFFGYRKPDLWETQFYLYMYKKILKDANDFSHKTYNLLGGGDPVMSYGLSTKLMLPEYKLTLRNEIYIFEYIYNDYWLDFSRFGTVFGADYAIDEHISASIGLGYYEDQYQLGMLRQGDCNFKTKASSDDGPDPQTCPHKDTGMMYNLGMYYDLSQFSKLSFVFTMIENKNPSLIIYERNDMTFNFAITTSFPSNDRVSRFIQRYADYAFEKNLE